jgi:perosamine synthetase
VGFNYRMTDIQAAIGIKQLEKLDWIVSERRKVAEAYHKGFQDLSCVQLPIEAKGYVSNYQSYSIYLKPNCQISRNTLMERLLDVGIATRRGIMTIHREIAYKSASEMPSLPVSEDLHDNSIIIPLYVLMDENVVNLVIETISSLVQNEQKPVLV